MPKARRIQALVQKLDCLKVFDVQGPLLWFQELFSGPAQRLFSYVATVCISGHPLVGGERQVKLRSEG